MCKKNAPSGPCRVLPVGTAQSGFTVEPREVTEQYFFSVPRGTEQISPRRAGGFIPPGRDLIAIGQNQTLIAQSMLSVFVAVIPAPISIGINSSRATEGRRSKRSERAHPVFSSLSGFRVAFYLPGMTILLPKMSNFASPPAEPGVYPKG